MIYEFLNLFFCICTIAKVTFCVDVEECRVTANGHSSTILLFNSAKVAEVDPLHSFFNVFSWPRNIVTIRRSHFFQFLQGTNLLLDFFTVANYIFKHIAHCDAKLFFFVFDKVINTIQRDTAIVTDDTATAVSIRQTSYDVSCTSGTHFWCVHIKYTIVMSFTMFSEEVFCLRIHFEAVFFNSGFRCAQATIREHSAF